MRRELKLLYLVAAGAALVSWILGLGPTRSLPQAPWNRVASCDRVARMDVSGSAMHLEILEDGRRVYGETFEGVSRVDPSLVSATGDHGTDLLLRMDGDRPRYCVIRSVPGELPQKVLDLTGPEALWVEGPGRVHVWSSFGESALLTWGPEGFVRAEG